MRNLRSEVVHAPVEMRALTGWDINTRAMKEHDALNRMAPINVLRTV